MTEEPAGTWLCPKCSPNASFYVKQLVKRRAASPPLPRSGKVAASNFPKGKESRSTSETAATATPAPAKNKAQKQEVDTKNENRKAVKKGVAMKKPAQKKTTQKWQGWVELPSDEEEELKRKIDAEWAMENGVTGKRRRYSRLAAEENETSSYGLRPRVGKKEVVKTDSTESSENSIENESSDEDESVYQEEVEDEEDEDEDENEEESSVERKKSVTGIFSDDFSPDTNMEEDEDEEQSVYQEEEDDSDNDEGTSEDEGSSLSSPAAVPRNPSVVSISSTSPCSSSSDTMDVDGGLTPRQSDKSRADSQTPSPSNRKIKDDEDDDDEDEPYAQPPATSPLEENPEDYMDVAQEEHGHVSSDKSDSDYCPTSSTENGSDDDDVVSTSSDTPTLISRPSDHIDLTSPQSGTPASPSVIILRSPYESSEEHELQPGTPASPSVIILRSPYESSEEHEPQPGTPVSPSVIILRDGEMETDESEHEDSVFVTVTPAVQFNTHAALFPNRVEFLHSFPDSADRSTLPRLG